MKKINKNTGIWIDHKRAFIVMVRDEEEKTWQIESDADSSFRAKGGSSSARPHGAYQEASSNEKKIDEKRKLQLHHYYQEVISNLIGADKIYILGPGEAKLELEKELNKSKDSEGRIVATEKADKMTDRQIIAKVRDYFRLPRSRSRR